MTPEDRIFRSTDARQLLENPLFVKAFAAVEGHLNSAALSCDPDSKDKAQRIIISQQLLAAVKSCVLCRMEKSRKCSYPNLNKSANLRCLDADR